MVSCSASAWGERRERMLLLGYGEMPERMKAAIETFSCEEDGDSGAPLAAAWRSSDLTRRSTLEPLLLSALLPSITDDITMNAWR